MWPSFAAESVKMVRRPGTWLLLAVAVVLSVVFTYLAPYAAYLDGSGGVLSDRTLDQMLPERLVGNSISGLPVFLGAICLILAVLTVGGEYAWGTWKTLLTSGPSRLAVYLGKLLVLAAATLVLVLVLFAVGAVSSALIAVTESQPLHWPTLGDLGVGIGAGWLIGMVWAGFGVLLAVLLRGVALPIGLGLVWLLAVQNLLAAVAAPILDWVAEMQKGLPGPNAGSLAAALGATADTPGIGAVVGAGQASVTLAGYLLGFILLAGVLLGRRDIL
ncbi:ABC transporter permease subunit [Plantactinospora sp. B6F1]|uniref:ABC transporter permease subunit n=1 Tax=Plantactinospora sp. B6F1 TaxID=3158971 RepID=UPI00102C010E